MVNPSGSSDMPEIELICVIINFGLASKLIQTVKRCGISGGTVLLGKGTVNSRILDFFGLAEVKKEIVYMVAERGTAYQALKKLNQEYEFHKPNHGIAFTTSIHSAAGTKSIKGNYIEEERNGDDTMYHVITVIVDKGEAEEVIEAAAKAGSKGGTIINGRGSGVHETSKLFSMEIEPEKEIVVILSEVDMTEPIVSSIRQALKIDEPGKGIIYIQDVNKTYGIYK
ncbi:P-II family nitrogen regulator [Acetonema longum]|uniref:Nitrogen regulatory protein P-II n=1 Tax=Acetonema longum DSM 6540 TaxID=1009370 RepID=F7NJA7_9FIRM|nr:P-II family nitrogen regulator [Acetonema longum]EGO63855.1 nitrogen regulatory protein P-II [Acetonema longum DSM 6540]